MDPTGKTFTSEDPRKWIGRIIMAVILGEAIWNLIVSVMNNLVVPWLGDLFGQSSGLPTSFTQRPYNYPDLFVSILEFCIAALVAAIINYFFQRPRAVRVKTVKSAAPIAPVEPLRVVPRSEAPAPHPQAAMTPAPTQHTTRNLPTCADPTCADPGNDARRPASARREAGPDYPSGTCDRSSASARSTCRAGTRSKTRGSRSCSPFSSGFRRQASAAPAQSPARQTDENQRGLLQHCRRTHAVRR